MPFIPEDKELRDEEGIVRGFLENCLEIRNKNGNHVAGNIIVYLIALCSGFLPIFTGDFLHVFCSIPQLMLIFLLEIYSLPKLEEDHGKANQKTEENFIFFHVRQRMLHNQQ